MHFQIKYIFQYFLNIPCVTKCLKNFALYSSVSLVQLYYSCKISMENPDVLPFKVGQLAEAKCFAKGYRGAWFRCKVSSNLAINF